MTIALTGTGGLFTRWGLLLGGSNEVQNHINGTLGTRVNNIEAQFQSNQQQLMDGFYGARDSYRTAPQTWLGDLQTLMQNTLIQMAKDDGTGINPEDLQTALSKLITQMTAASASIQKPTVTATVTAGGSNVGNGTCIVSVLDAKYATQQDYIFAETLTALCTRDGNPGGGATLGSEPFSITGQTEPSSIFQYNYPTGSGTSQNITSFNPELTTGTIITDGGFENWTGNSPTKWNVTVGTPGTTLFKGTSPYLGSANLQFTGNGTELTALRQTITLEPNTVYALNVMGKQVSVAAGVLRIRLINGTTFATINDNAGNANAITSTLSALTGSYTAINGFFRTPAVLPSSVMIEFALTTAITNTAVANFDDIGLVAVDPAYDGGPYIAIFRGSNPWAINDTFNIAIANNNSISTFSRQLERYLGLRTSGLKIPSNITPTIADGLIT